MNSWKNPLKWKKTLAGLLTLGAVHFQFGGCTFEEFTTTTTIDSRDVVSFLINA